MFNTGFIALTLKKFQINVFASKPKKVVGQNIWALKIPPILLMKLGEEEPWLSENESSRVGLLFIANFYISNPSKRLKE